MNRRFGWTVGLLLLAGLGIVVTIGLLRPGFAPAEGMSSSASATATAAEALGYHTEQEWIVWDVTRTIVQIAAFVRSGTIPSATEPITVTTDPVDPAHPAAEPRFTIRIAGRAPLHVTATDHIWAPAAYLDLTRALLGSPTTSSDPNDDPTGTALLSALIDLRAEVLIDQSARVSASLTDHPTSAIAHERAALLTGALMLREAARSFTDVRAEFSRMTAHLAVAGALRGTTEPSLDGAMADLLLRLGVYHHRDALEQLDRLAAASPSDTMRVWQRALRLRITNDWRAPQQPERATLIERLEYLRSVRSRLSSSRMLDFLDRFEPEPITDWRRIAMSRASVSIETGNRLVGSGTDQELDEATRVWKAFHDGEASQDRVIQDLNAENTGPVQRDRNGRASVQVLGWDLWAPFLQRHLCAQLIFLWQHNAGLGVPDRNRTLLIGQIGRSFGTLRLYPIVLKQFASRSEDYQRAIDGARDLARRHPGLLTPEIWDALREKPDFAKEPLSFPDKTAWFTPLVPSGTAFDLDMRAFPVGGAHVSTEDLERWARISPYNYLTLWNVTLRRTGGKPDFEAVQTAYATLAPYTSGALIKLHDAAATTEQRIVASRPLCDLDPDDCDLLGSDLLEAGQEAEAASIFERYALHARDTVSVSQKVSWIVRYDYDEGRLTEALEIGQRVADTGSESGLQTLALLFDRMGRFRDAERLYERIGDRYGDRVELGAFYLRRARRSSNAADERLAVSLLKAPFPNGVEWVSPASFSGPPTDGVRITQFGARAARIGLLADDVIVAIDGVRVRDSWQYNIASRFGLDGHMAVIVWREGRYQELFFQVPQRLFGIRYETLKTT